MKKPKSLNDEIQKRNDELKTKLTNFRQKRINDYNEHCLTVLKKYLHDNLQVGDRYQVEMRVKELMERAFLKTQDNFPDLNELLHQKLKLMMVEFKKSVPEYEPKKGKKDESDKMHERVEPIARQILTEFFSADVFKKELLFLDTIISDSVGAIFRTLVGSVIQHMCDNMRESISRSKEAADMKLWGGVYPDEIPVLLVDNILKDGKS